MEHTSVHIISQWSIEYHYAGTLYIVQHPSIGNSLMIWIGSHLNSWTWIIYCVQLINLCAFKDMLLHGKNSLKWSTRQKADLLVWKMLCWYAHHAKRADRKDILRKKDKVHCPYSRPTPQQVTYVENELIDCSICLSP